MATRTMVWKWKLRHREDIERQEEKLRRSVPPLKVPPQCNQ